MITVTTLQRVLTFFHETQDISEKNQLQALFSDRFNATKSRSIYDTEDGMVSVRFSQSKKDSNSVSNTIISLKVVKPRDQHPILSVLVTPGSNYVRLMNSSFIKKVSHSSQNLSLTNITGSINYSDILKEFNGVPNDLEHIQVLFNLHSEHGFDENLPRIVEETLDIMGTKKRVTLSDTELISLRAAPARSLDFCASENFAVLEADLINRVSRNSTAIATAALIDNVNLRGRIIETLITSDDVSEIAKIAKEVKEGITPSIMTGDALADYERLFEKYLTGTDIKTKVMYLSSAPKAFSIDDMLKYLAQSNTVFFFFFVGVEQSGHLHLKLLPLFDKQMIETVRVEKHWSGRLQRGHAQFDGAFLHNMLTQNPYIPTSVSEQEGISILERWYATK